MIQRLIRTFGNVISKYPNLFKPMISLQNSGLRIIYYHYIGNQKKEYYFSKNHISLNVFQKQIKFLKTHFDFIPLSQAINKCYNGDSLDGYFTITTDDGFKENYTQIAPILIENRLKATFFLITDCIDNKNLMWRNKLIVISNRITLDEQLKAAKACANNFNIKPIQNGENLFQWSSRTWPMKIKDFAANFIWEFAKIGNLDSYLRTHKPYLEISQIKELINQGFEIGSHSKSHPYFSKLSLQELKDEIFGSTLYLQRTFPNNNCNILSLPFGHRVSKKLEIELFQKDSKNITSMLGIHSALSNNSNPLKWQRDPLELDYYLSIGTFFMIPLYRRIINSVFNKTFHF